MGAIVAVVAAVGIAASAVVTAVGIFSQHANAASINHHTGACSPSSVCGQNQGSGLTSMRTAQALNTHHP